MPSIEVVIAAFLAILMIASIVSLRARVPYTLVLVFVGIGLTAASASFYFGSGPIQSQVSDIILAIRSIFGQLVTTEGNASLFVGLVVPPLIFEAMTHIRSNDLRDVIRPSFFLATVGVVIATLVCGIVLWKIAGLSPYVSFLFAALIAPTDVATVLEIFKRAKVPAKLSALMDTEAAFNDATAIVIFAIVLTSINVQRPSVFTAAAQLVFVLAGGIVVGLVVAFAAEVLTSLISDRLSEVILTISAVYGSYALATSLGVSGLISVTIVGLYFGNLTIKSAMGPATREAVSMFWEFAAFVGNSIAFLFIGFQTDILSLAKSFVSGLIPISYLAVTAARVASVYPILSVDRIEKKKIPFKWMNVATLGGMRGALSIALVASITTSALITSSDIGTISAMVLGVAFISISLQAALLFRYIKSKFPEEQVAVAEALNVRLSRSVTAIESLQKLKEEGKISDEEFASQLETDKDELREVLKEINATVDTRNLLKARASNLYASVVTLPMSRAMQILRFHRLSKPIETMITKTTMPPEQEESAESSSRKVSKEDKKTTPAEAKAVEDPPQEKEEDGAKKAVGESSVS